MKWGGTINIQQSKQWTRLVKYFVTCTEWGSIFK